MSGNGNIKCPVHGEHGNSSNGRCWYCVQSGMMPAVKQTVVSQPAKLKRIF